MSYKIYRIKKGCIILTWLKYGLWNLSSRHVTLCCEFRKATTRKMQIESFVWALCTIAAQGKVSDNIF